MLGKKCISTARTLLFLPLSTSISYRSHPADTFPDVQVVEGRDGAKAVGFDASHRSTLHTSPLLFDIDFDGVQDIVVATYDGDILFFKDNVSSMLPATGMVVHT